VFNIVKQAGAANPFDRLDHIPVPDDRVKRFCCQLMLPSHIAG